MEIANQRMQGGIATNSALKIKNKKSLLYISKFHPEQIKSSESYNYYKLIFNRL
jgi:hypothetical protein